MPAADRCRLVHKVRKAQLQKRLRGLQMRLQALQHLPQLVQRYRVKILQDLHKAAHVRTALLLRQRHRHVDACHRVLHAFRAVQQLQWPPQPANAHAAQRNMS